MNGISTPEMAGLLGVYQTAYTSVENAHNVDLGNVRTKQILEHNLFSFPTNKQGRVEDDYTHTLLKMVGGEHYFPRYLKPQLFAAVKAISQAYLNGELTIEEMPSLNDLMLTLSDHRLFRFISAEKASAIKLGNGVAHSRLEETSALYQLGDQDYTPYFAAMPYESKKHGRVASVALNPEQAFELATNTTTELGAFLRLYRESTGEASEDLAKKMKKSRERVRQLEAQERHSDEFIAEILGAKNPYGFPVDSLDNVRFDVVELVRDRYIPPRTSTGKMSTKEVAMITQQQADKERWVKDGTWLKLEAAMDSLLARVDADGLTLDFHDLAPITGPSGELQLAGKEGTFNIGDVAIRYRQGVDGEYRIQADGLVALRDVAERARNDLPER